MKRALAPGNFVAVLAIFNVAEARTVPATSPWQSLIHQPSFCAGSMLLLTDGTVLTQDVCANTNGGSNWWKLVPDDTGSYLKGTWTQVAPMPAGYNPLYYGSAVLPGGQVVVEGGEYDLDANQYAWMGRGAYYDPVANSWTSIAPPAGMSLAQYSIGDAMSLVLANGKYMLSPVYIPASGPQQILNFATLAWTASGSNKAGPSNDEAGQILLPNGDVLTVDVGYSDPDHTEVYNPATGAWSFAGDTPKPLSAGGEIGPLLLRPNGTVFAAGASGHNAVYTASTKKWSAAPDFPVIGGYQYATADAPGAVLPSGNALIMASGINAANGSHFFEFNGSTLSQVADTANAASLLPYYCRMVVLPTGQVLFNGGGMQLYTPSGSAQAAWAPTISAVSKTLKAGGAYSLSGTQLAGLSQGAGYGDDYQSATNYPLVRITNKASGHVFYARTYGHTSASVAAHAKSSTKFQLPGTIETGASTLVVVANGIASTPEAVTVSAASAERNGR